MVPHRCSMDNFLPGTLKKKGEKAMLRAEVIKGFEELSDSNQNIFKHFLENFLNIWGFDARKNIFPVGVKECSDNEYGQYIRFDYKYYKHSEWLHVKGPCTWY